MTKKIKILLVFMAIALAAIFYLSKDDDLNSDAQAMLDVVDWQTPTDSFLYFLGMQAPLGVDPLVEGADILSEIRLIEQSYLSSKAIEEYPYLQDRPNIEMPEYDGLCSLTNQKKCNNGLFSITDVSLQTPEIQALIKRFLHFMNMNDYRAMTQPHTLEPFGPFSLLVTGNRLVNLEAISLAQKSREDAIVAVKNLYELLSKQRRYLADTDSLIARAIAYGLVNETIDVISILLRQYNIPGELIKPLSPQELSLQRVISREFKYITSGLNLVSQQPEYKGWPSWLWKLVFKRNMTINQAYPNFNNAIKASQSKQSEFEIPQTTLVSSWLRNSVGTHLNKISMVDFSDYIARGFDLNVKIHLFNGVVNKPINTQVLPKLNNPYYLKKAQVFLSNDSNRICLDGPLENGRSFRCIPFKLTLTSD